MGADLPGAFHKRVTEKK